jgi:hypothetical protein
MQKLLVSQAILVAHLVLLTKIINHEKKKGEIVLISPFAIGRF